MSQSVTKEIQGIEEVGSDEGVIASLGIQPGLFVFQLLNLGIVFAIVWFLILKPLTKKLEERRQIIDESLDNAKRLETEVKMAEARAQDIIDAAKSEANSVIGRASGEAVTAGEVMKQKAKKEIETLVVEAKKNIEQEKELARSELRQESATLVMAAVEKILQEKMDAKKDESYVRSVLSSLTNNQV